MAGVWDRPSRPSPGTADEQLKFTLCFRASAGLQVGTRIPPPAPRIRIKSPIYPAPGPFRLGISTSRGEAPALSKLCMTTCAACELPLGLRLPLSPAASQSTPPAL